LMQWIWLWYYILLQTNMQSVFKTHHNMNNT
jgi:hypothetical protein